MLSRFMKEWSNLEDALITKILMWSSIIAIVGIIALSVVQRIGGPVYYVSSILMFLKIIGYYIPAVAASYLFSRDYYEGRKGSHHDCYGVQSYFSKLLVVVSVFGITFLVTCIETKMRDLHTMIVFLCLIPLMALVGMLIKNLFFSVILQLFLCRYILGYAAALQENSSFKDYLISYLSNEMILRALRDFFVGDKVRILFTSFFCLLSVLSLFIGIFIFLRKMKQTKLRHRGELKC